MCGRYYIAEEDMEEELRAVIEILNRRPQPEGLKLGGEVRPTDIAPVIARNRRREKSAFAMRWGYALPGGALNINARSETAAAKPLFRESMARRRCVVPASFYFEWEKRGRERLRYAIRPADRAPTLLAGLYRLTEGLPEFTILTRAPAPEIAFIHERMPVLLPPSLVDDWLDTDNAAEAILGSAITNLRFEQG